jgi:hypothetical protein
MLLDLLKAMLKSIFLKTLTLKIVALMLLCAATISFSQQRRAAKTASPKSLRTKQSTEPRNKSLQKPNKSVQAPQQTVNKETFDWIELVGPDGDFTILSPLGMQRRVSSEHQGTLTEIREYVADTPDTHLSILMQDLDIPKSDPLFNETNSDIARLTAKQFKAKGWRIVSVRQVAKNISEIEAWFPTPEPDVYMHTFLRSTVHHGRLFMMSCGSRIFNREVSNRTLCTNFFESFRYVGHKQQQRD